MNRPPRKRRFLGESSHTVDAKGRMSLPKKHHTSLDLDEQGRPAGVLLLEPTRGECLWVLNDEGFDLELKEFETPGESGASPTHRDKQRDMYRHVTDFSLDTSGRLTLPAGLRSKVGIEGEVMVVGLNTRLEIWSKPLWDARFGDPAQ